MTRPRRPFRAQPRHPITGRQFNISARTQRELDSYLHHIDTLREELRLGVRTPEEIGRTLRRLQHGATTVGRAAVAYARREGLAPETSRRVLSSWLGGPGRELAPLELEALDAPRMQQWIDHLVGEQLAASTIRWAWWTLSAIARYAKTRGWIGASPWGDWRPIVKGPRRKEREAARSPEELAELLAAAAAVDVERLKASRLALGDLEARIAAVALLGLRQGELAGLRWRDVDWKAETVTIARQWQSGRPPKGRAVCTLRALPELFALLREVRARLEAMGLLSKSADGPVFPSQSAAIKGSIRHHTPVGAAPLSIEDLRLCVARAELPRPRSWTATSLRDTFATLEAAAYADNLPGLQTRTRHASISSLLRYLRSRSRELAPPGFALPPAAPLPPLLPSASSTASASTPRRRSPP